MNAYEFGQQIAALEKEAITYSGVVNKVTAGARRMAQQGAKAVRQKAVSALNKSTPAAAGAAAQPNMVQRFGQRAQQAGQGIFEEAYTAPSMLQKATGVGREAGKFVAGEVGRVGRGTANAARRGLNTLDDTYHSMRGIQRPAAGPNSLRVGNRYIGRNQLAARDLANSMGMPGVSSPNNPLNPFNVGVGAGALAGGYKGLQSVGNAAFGSEPTPENLNAQQMTTQLAQGQHMEAAPNNNNNGGLMGMWNSLPVEARYAIGAGVPLALAGAFMGGRGNYGAGGAMGALGLGAAGLGAAGAGMFGDGARRMVGQGANSLYGMMGGGGGGPMDQINSLGRLSPEFGTTMLMGRDPNMNSAQGRQMYDFLTHNRNIIEQLMPQLQNASTTGVKQSAALEFGKIAGRCWKGYEPVPGKAPYSDGSCRPVGSKKKTDKKEKKAAAPFTGQPATPQISPESSTPPNWDEAHARQHLKAHDSQYRDNMPPNLAYKRTLHLGSIKNPNKVTPFQNEMKHKYNGQPPRFQPAAPPATAMNATQSPGALATAMIKTQAAKAAGVAGQGKTTMNAAPSSRGNKKLVDDKQRPAPSPVSTDATNAKDTGEKAAAPFKKMDLTQYKTKAKAQPVKKKLKPAEDEKEAAGLWANINAKKKRGDKPAKPGDKDYPAAKSWKKVTSISKKEAAVVSGLARGIGAASRMAARGVGSGARTISRATGAAAGELGRSAVNRGAQMARGGASQMMQGGVGNALGGGIRAATGAGMYGAGQVARGVGGVARFAGTQVPGSTMMNAARTATALPVAGLALGGAYRAVAPAADPYVNSAQQFGSGVANRIGQGVQQAGQAVVQGAQQVGQGAQQAGQAVVQGAQQAGQAAMAVPRAIGQGVNAAGSAIGDAAGTAYGTTRNAVVNTANDVRRGVTNAAQTARASIPNVRNPFYYQQ